VKPISILAQTQWRFSKYYSILAVSLKVSHKELFLNSSKE